MNGISPALFQAVRGPIMLITFGVLVAIDHSGYGLSFWRTWPLLFIVYGVLKLVERLLPRPVVYAPPQPLPPQVPPPGRAS
jgi:hypothetical protein